MSGLVPVQVVDRDRSASVARAPRAATCRLPCWVPSARLVSSAHRAAMLRRRSDSSGARTGA